MQQLLLTLDTPAENLALDEALLDAAEAGEVPAGVLRLWESPQYCAVLGRSSSAQVEVDLAACHQAGVAVLRRSSGGGTILAGPGCLMYAVVLDFAAYPQLQAVGQAHQYVLGRLAASLAPNVPRVDAAGISDLAIAVPGGWRKFSGNALRVKRRHILYHGTLLYDFQIERIGQFLAAPTRTPEYRGDRPHTEFVTNLPLTGEQLRQALLDGWQAHVPLQPWPRQRVADLVSSRYGVEGQWMICET